MREIKFRAKGDDEETKNRWFYGGYAKLDKTTYCFKEDYDRNPDNTVHYIIFEEMTDWGLPNRHLRASVNPETVGQYTGLHDKNGKEIYEGDIVKIHKHNYDFGFKQDEIGQIKFIDGAFGFYREKNEKEYYFNDLATENGYGELDYYEVIGNIYDNPELLEKG